MTAPTPYTDDELVQVRRALSANSPWTIARRALATVDRFVERAERAETLADAARELLDAEAEMHQLDAEWNDAVELAYDQASQSAALDRAIAARHRYTAAHNDLGAALDARSTEGSPE